MGLISPYVDTADLIPHNGSHSTNSYDWITPLAASRGVKCRRLWLKTHPQPAVATRGDHDSTIVIDVYSSIDR